jgi:hypothetical protein
MQTRHSVDLDPSKLQQHILDVASIAMTNASDWQYRLESNELVLTCDRSGLTFRFAAPAFSCDSDQAPLTNRTADVRIKNEGSLFLFHPLFRPQGASDQRLCNLRSARSSIVRGGNPARGFPRSIDVEV